MEGREIKSVCYDSNTQITVTKSICADTLHAGPVSIPNLAFAAEYLRA